MGQVLALESIPSADECAADINGSKIVFRVADGSSIEKGDDWTVTKKLVRLANTHDSIAVKVTGKGNNPWQYESEYTVKVMLD